MLNNVYNVDMSYNDVQFEDTHPITHRAMRTDSSITKIFLKFGVHRKYIQRAMIITIIVLLTITAVLFRSSTYKAEAGPDPTKPSVDINSF